MKHPLHSPTLLSSIHLFYLGRRLPLAAIFLVLIVWMGAFLNSTVVASQQNIPSLELSKAIQKTLAGGETHNYGVRARAGQFLRIVVEQRGIDVKLTLFAPDGSKLLEVDSPNGEQGPETASLITAATGDYRIEVKSEDKEAKAGRYEARLEVLRAATEADSTRVAAERAAAEGEHLYEGDANAKRAALEKYTEALELWRKLDDQRGTADALSNLADLHRDLREYPQSAARYQEALPYWRALKDQSQEASMLHNLGAVAYFTGDRPKAVEYFTQALPLRRAAKDVAGEATTLNFLAVTYIDQGEFRQALAMNQQALPLRRASNDRRGQSQTLNSLGAAYSGLGQKRQALESYRQALQLRRALKDAAGQAQTLSSMGAVYSDLGEQQQALDAYAQALPLRRAARDTRGEAITFINLGRSYDLLGAPQEAINYYNQALPVLREAKDRLWEGRALNFMGLAYWSSGEYEKALNAYDQALPIRRELQDKTGEGEILNNVGLAHDSLGDPRKAVASYQQALPLLRATSNRLGETRTLNNLGFAYEAMGDRQQALAHHEQALKLNREIGDRQREAKIRYGIARIESSLNNLKPARNQIEQTIKIVESLRTKLVSPELRASYRASAQRYYDLYIDVLMRMGKRAPKSRLTAEALQVSERARARSLIELLTEASADIRQGVDAKLVERERELQEQINYKATEQIRLLGTRAKAEQIAAAGKEIEQLNADLRDVQSQIRTTSPRYANLTQPQPLAARDIQRLLDANTMLLEFSLGEERSYLWAVTPAAIYSYTLPKRAEIEAAAKRFYDAVTARNQFVSKESNQQKQARVAQADKDSLTAAATLGRMLLAPVAPLLGNKRLIVVADGSLQYVPFGALTLRTAQSSRPLVANHEMISLPSASTLAALRGESAERQKASKTVAVIADPVFEAKDERVKVISIKADGNGDGKTDNAAKKDSKPAEAPLVASDPSRILLYKSAKDSGATDSEFRIPRLPNTRREADTILSLAGNTGKSAFDFAATRAAAAGDDLGQYRILHFATHGFLNSLNPELSGLVLSMVDEQGKSQNGYLLAPEIYNLKLPATELVVLSACQTGLGKEVRGEGVVGLTRGFMYAGAPRVVVSLWSVNDRSTADLMKHFYEAMLAKGQRPSAALRSAQLQLMQSKQWQSPYYWAAFGLQGEWR